MILNNIDNLYVGSTNALKVYLGSLLIWSRSSDGYDIITTDITSYTGSKSRVYVVDVSKWYMRTVGGNYKEYGVYALSKSADPYVGELAIDNGHEWEYTSNGWVDLGAYSEPEYFLTKTNASNYAIEFGHYWNNSYKMVVDCYFSGASSADVGPIILRETDRSIFELAQYQNGFYLDFHEPTSTSSPTVDTGDYTARVVDANATQIPKDGTRLRLRLTTTKFVAYDYASGSILYNSGTEGATYNYCTTGKYLTGIWSGSNGNTTAVHSIQIVDDSNNLVNNFVVKKRDVSGDNEFYVQDTVSGDIFENSTIGANFTYSQVGTLVRPKAYTAMSAPVDVISTDFSSYTGNADRVYVVDINKWYMRTIGGNYTEYGIYASSKSADPYVGELAIDNGHEWEYTENGWVDLGAYRLPSGYTELTYVNSQYRNSQTAPYIELNYYPNEDTSITSNFKLSGSYVEGTLYDVYPSTPQTKFRFNFDTRGVDPNTYTMSFWDFYPITEYRVNAVQVNTNYKLLSGDSGAYLNKTRIASRVNDEDDPEYVEFVQDTSKLRILWSSSTYQNVNLYSFYVRELLTEMYNFIPCRRDSDGKIGLYNTIDGNFYLPDNEATNPFIAGDVIPRPKEYAVLPSPVDYDIISTDITSYTGSASRVYVTDVDKWYMRTVEGNYTEYGVYASSKTTDAYIGELAKVDSYVWKYMNYGWSRLGVSLEPEYFLTKNSTAHPSSYIISVGHYWNNGWKMIVDCYFSSTYSGDVGGITYFNQGASIFEFCQNANGFYLDFHAPTSTSSPTTNTGDYTTRVNQSPVKVIPKDGTRMLVRLTTTRVVFSNYETGSNIYWKGTEGATYNYCTTGKYTTGIWSGRNGNTSAVHAIKILDDSDNVVHNFVVKKRDTTGNREFYIQDTVNGDIFENTTGGSFSYTQIGTLIEPKDYPVIPSPLTN